MKTAKILTKIVVIPGWLAVMATAYLHAGIRIVDLVWSIT